MNATNSSMTVEPLAKQVGVKINPIRYYERRGRNYWPLILGVVASGAFLLGKFVLDASPLTVGGVGLLIGAYLWSFWLRRPKASSCQSYCAPATTAAPEKRIAPETMINPEIPIACPLGHGQFAERRELVQHLLQETTARRELPNGVGLRFKPVSGRVTELAKLVDLERACRPFLTFRIDAPAGGPVWLELTGTAAAQEIIRELALLGSDCAAGRRLHDLRDVAAHSRFVGAFEHVLWNQMVAGKFSRTFDPEDRRRLFD